MDNAPVNTHQQRQEAIKVARDLLQDIGELKALTINNPQAQTADQKDRIRELTNSIVAHGNTINAMLKQDPNLKTPAFSLSFDCTQLPLTRPGFEVITGEALNLIKKLGG